MSYYRLETINTIWTKTISVLLLALALFLWGWLKPEGHIMFLTQIVTFPVRPFLWIMSFLFSVMALSYLYRSFNAWMDRP